MTDKPLGRVIDIDAYFESLQHPQPQASEAVVSVSTTNMPQPEATQNIHLEDMPPAPNTNEQPPQVWPKEGGLSIEEMLSFEPEAIILLSYLKGNVLNQGIDHFVNRYEKHLNFHGFWPGLEAIPYITVKREKYQQAAESFLREGYLCSPSGYQHLDGYTVKEIQAFLRSQKMKVSGKRDELIARLKESFSAAEIEQTFPAEWLILTPKGDELMEYHGHLSFFWEKYLCPYRMNVVHEFRRMNPRDSSYDVTLKALQEIVILPENHWEFAHRSRLLSMGDCCEFFGKFSAGAIYWALICYIDIHEAVIHGWGRKPSLSSLCNGIVANLEQGLKDNPLESIKDDFFENVEKIRARSSKKLCSPDIAWEILRKELNSK